MAQYDPDELGFLDEMSRDAHSISQRFGRSRKNQHAMKKQPFVRGRRTSTTSFLTLEGITASTVVEGSMTKELFHTFLEEIVVSFRDFYYYSSYRKITNEQLASKMYCIPRTEKCFSVG